MSLTHHPASHPDRMDEEPDFGNHEDHLAEQRDLIRFETEQVQLYLMDAAKRIDKELQQPEMSAYERRCAIRRELARVWDMSRTRASMHNALGVPKATK